MIMSRFRLCQMIGISAYSMISVDRADIHSPIHLFLAEREENFDMALVLVAQQGLDTGTGSGRHK